MKHARGHLPSPALVIAVIALVAAFSGGAYAALKLPANSVGAVQVKKNAITSAKVKDGSLLSRDFASGQLPAGPKGDPGPTGETGAKGATGDTGAQGPAGSARAYAAVGKDGTFRNSKNVVGVTHPSAGVYCITVDSSIDTASAVLLVTPDFASDETNFFFNATQAIVEWDSNGCASGALKVRTGHRAIDRTGSADSDIRNVINAAADEGFSFMVP